MKDRLVQIEDLRSRVDALLVANHVLAPDASLDVGQGRVDQPLGELAGQFPAVADRHECARPDRHEAARARDVGRHHAACPRHRLQRHHGELLASGREQHHVRRGEPVEDVGRFCDDADVAGIGEPRLQGHAVRTVTDQGEQRAGQGAADLRPRVEQVGLAVVRAQLADADGERHLGQLQARSC